MVILHEARWAARRLLAAPTFTGLTILTLGLTLGVDIGIFGVIDAVLLQPLDLPEADRLVSVYETRGAPGHSPLSLPDFRDLEEQTKTLSGVAAHYPTAPLSVGVGDAVFPVEGSVVSSTYFSVLGVEPGRGRFFAVDDAATAVVSDRFWRDSLGSREDVLGSALTVNGEPFEIVGVAPPGFEGVVQGLPSRIWIPMSMARVGYRWCDPSSRDCRFLVLVGRRAPGISLEAVGAEVEALSLGLRQEFPREKPTSLSAVSLHRLHPDLHERSVRLASLLMAAVTLLVVIAGANLAAMVRVRSLSRSRALATCRALGAERWRLRLGFQLEALLLAVGGGALGLLVGGYFAPLVAVLYPGPVAPEIELGSRSVVYAVGLSLVVGAFLGRVAELGSARASILSLRRADRGFAGSMRGTGFLLGLQVLLSFVLLSAAWLLAASLEGARRQGTVDPARVATMRLRPRLVDYGPERAHAVHRELLERLRADPNVISAGLARGLPPFRFFEPVAVNATGRDGGGAGETASWTDAISPGLLETVGFALQQGRDFDSRDRPGSLPVALVDERLAASLWPDREALGRHLLFAGEEREVVGVFRDLGYLDRSEAPMPRVFIPWWQEGGLVDARYVVRYRTGGADRLGELRRLAAEVDSTVPVSEVQTMSDRLGELLAPVRLAGTVLGVSSALGLFLVALGLYSTLSLAVLQRRREIAIRVAVGGPRETVVREVLRGVLRPVGIAFALGPPTAWVVQQGLEHHLYGVSPYDPTVLAVAMSMLAVVAAVAAWRPTRAVASMDPATVLRAE